MNSTAFHRQARAELDEAIAWYESRAEGLGMQFLDEVEQTVRLISAHQEIGSRYKSTEFRYFPVSRFPYALYYCVLDGQIWIAAVAHQRRRPGYWTSRIND
ncbi:MAG: type II toxin-antitoxin system RelE/ParE family toxin [Planctomycetales bacterium]